jgi:DNA processing protein
VSDRAYWVAWSQIHGIGPVLLKRLDEQFGGLAYAWEATSQELQQVDGLGVKLAQSIRLQRREHSPSQLLKQLEAASSHFLTPSDAAYPALLYSIPDPPPLLFYRGDLDLLKQIQTGISIGIVGTRSPSEYGRRWTRKLTRHLVRHGGIIISGMAHGIDRDAHQTALAIDGSTIAVLGTGVDMAYPRSNQSLYDQIISKGLVISEYPDGTPPDKPHFPRRNRIIAGLSRAVLVTEAPQRSGALITARLANDYGREVYALPGSLDNPQAEGCLNLIAQGAQIVMDETTLLRGLGDLPHLDRDSESSAAVSTDDLVLPPDLSAELRQILYSLSRDPISFDQLLAQLPLETGTLLSALVQLEIMGLVNQIPGTQQYRRSLDIAL